MKVPGVLLTVLLPLVGSCGSAAIPKEEAEFAKQYLSELRAGHFDEVERRLSPELLTPDTRARLQAAANLFPPGEPTSVELVGSQVVHGRGWSSANLSFQYGFEQGWALANVALSRKEGGLVVNGVHVNRIPDALQRINAFTLTGKGLVHFLFLGGAVVVPAFILLAIAVCLRTRDLRRKWLWVVFIVLGVTGVTINWTTGQIAFQLLTVHLLGAGAVAASRFAPWLITVSFPLGAVVFLATRGRGRKGGPAGPTTATAN